MAKNCGRCWFFKNGDNPCSQLFQSTTSLACGDFKLLKQESHFEKPEPSPEYKLQESLSYQQDFFDIIQHTFNLEKDLSLITSKIKDEIEQQGYQLPFADDKIKSYNAKLTDLYVLYRLTLLNGMGRWADDIIKLKIQALFSKEPQTP